MIEIKEYSVFNADEICRVDLRRLLIEAAGGICKGQIGKKSKDLIARQNGN